MTGAVANSKNVSLGKLGGWMNPDGYDDIDTDERTDYQD
jgi:hypothetical protein